MIRNDRKVNFNHAQSYGLTPVKCPTLFFNNSEGLFSHSNGAVVCNRDMIIEVNSHFTVNTKANYYTNTINNGYENSEIFYSYTSGIGGYTGQSSNFFKVSKGDVISLSFGLNNAFSIDAKDLNVKLDVKLIALL